MSISIEREREGCIERIKHELDTTGVIPLDLVLEAHELGIIVTEVEDSHGE